MGRLSARSWRLLGLAFIVIGIVEVVANVVLLAIGDLNPIGPLLLIVVGGGIVATGIIWYRRGRNG